ncbi:MAG: tetraacyldisaccharide 4'-kinase [Bacteroidetes bacterium]|nr:tetraacyldisaccharide 4'-kinase [Bacteroidota bacterium]MBU1720555.1 tetraacyldisaccharide 4'-kinase [Bacteroidota bacterium]
MKVLRIFAFPLSMLYGIIMQIRNGLYNRGVFKSHSFSVKVISIGNLTAGGTGKSPHTAYIANLLSKYRVGILSRGYGRTTSGFVLADEKSTSGQIGDEPLMFSRWFPDIPVAVHENRVSGIKKMLELFPDLQVILLDDAFQHRSVKPGLSLLLTDFFHPWTKNFPFPTGTLREFRCGSKRADLVVVTKSPSVMSPLLERDMRKRLKIAPEQGLHFSYITHNLPEPVFDHPALNEKSYFTSILLLAGIANPYPLKDYLGKMCSQMEIMQFPDHHKYSLNDIENIRSNFHNIVTQNKIIVTTEKDLMRLEKEEFVQILKDLPLYFVQIQTHLHDEHFDETILHYVREN